MHKPPLAVRIIVALIVLSTIGYYTFRSLAPKENEQLTASGTIEAVMVLLDLQIITVTGYACINVS